jgi:hypothetical protein
MAYYQGLLLIALPISILPFNPLLKWQKNGIYGVSILYILVLSIIFVLIQKIDITVDYVMRIDKALLPLSILGSVVIYFFFAKIFFNKTLLDIPLFLKKLNYKRILISFSVFAIIFFTVKYLNPKSTPLYSTAQTLRDPTLYALIKPLFAIVADVSFWGILVCLLIIFWSSFCKTVSQMGWGLVGALALNLFLFGITPQSRHLINILPWLVVFLVKSINKYSFSNSFYVVVGLLCFIGSKIWFLLNKNEGYPPMHLDKNGSMGFPYQKLWMNIGPWMSEPMYYVQAAVWLIFMVILFFTLYKVERNNADKIQLVRKFKI